MRKFKVYMDTPYSGINPIDEFEMPDDATDEEIKEAAKDVFFNTFNYGYEELKEGESNDQ